MKITPTITQITVISAIINGIHNMQTDCAIKCWEKSTKRSQMYQNGGDENNVCIIHC